MDTVIPLDAWRMFVGEEPLLYYLEIVVRVVLIYTYAAVLLRLMGKRGMGSVSPFEYVVVIALGSATGDVMFYPDVPLLYAFLIITLIVFLVNILLWLQYRFPRLQVFFEGRPTVLVSNGRVLEANLFKERIEREELYALLRNKQIRDVADVQLAVIEINGSISVLEYSNPHPTSSPKPTESTLQNLQA